MSDTPRTDDDLWSFPGPMKVAGGIKVYVRSQTARQLERELTAANERIKRLGREVELLRLYGNKDCTAQADEVLKKEAKP